MREVAVIGTGLVTFGEMWSKSLRTLWAEAALNALEDAGIDKVDASPSAACRPACSTARSTWRRCSPTSSAWPGAGDAGRVGLRLRGLALRAGFAEVAAVSPTSCWSPASRR